MKENQEIEKNQYALSLAATLIGITLQENVYALQMLSGGKF
jgi:hypothetical protein